MDSFKFKNHKQSKFFTIMLVPYSSKKTVSIRITRKFINVTGLIALLLAAVVVFVFSRAVYFRLEASSAGELLNEARMVNRGLTSMNGSGSRLFGAQASGAYGTLQEVLETEREYYLNELEAYQEETRELKLRLDSLNEDYANLKTETEEARAYLERIPGIWPAEGIVTSEMGSRGDPFGGPDTETHQGMDIAVNVGTDVAATGSGDVVYADWSPGYGYLVSIDHGYGIVSMYGHNSKILVSEGDRVKRGDIIAKSGNTGRSTGPHLHYEIQINGNPEDPREFLD